jgi:hypothetical protein
MSYQPRKASTSYQGLLQLSSRGSIIYPGPIIQGMHICTGKRPLSQAEAVWEIRLYSSAQTSLRGPTSIAAPLATLFRSLKNRMYWEEGEQACASVLSFSRRRQLCSAPSRTERSGSPSRTECSGRKESKLARVSLVSSRNPLAGELCGREISCAHALEFTRLQHLAVDRASPGRRSLPRKLRLHWILSHRCTRL